MPGFPKRTLSALTAIAFCGTLYSVIYETYLDTSNPLLTHLPHHLHSTHYFASKRNALNVHFTKKLWLWTTGAFFALYWTSPPIVQTTRRLLKYFIETAVWLLFTGWFFGPSLLERVTASTGGECVAHLPSGAVVTLPQEFCFTKSTVSPSTHPALFGAPLLLPSEDWRQVPRLRRGHDVSGHLFLLTMSILFLTEQLGYSFALRENRSNTRVPWPPLHKWALAANVLIIFVALFASYTTSVYFHTPLEKFTGFRKFLASSLRACLF